MRPRVIDKLLGLVLPTDGYKSWLDIGTGDGNTCCSHPYYDKIEHKVGFSVHLLKDFHEEGDALFAWKNNFIK